MSYHIPAPILKKGEELTVQQVATQFGVSDHVVYYWIERGLLQVRRLNEGMPYWITLNPSVEPQLRAWVSNSRRIQPRHPSGQLPARGAV